MKATSINIYTGDSSPIITEAYRYPKKAQDSIYYWIAVTVCEHVYVKDANELKTYVINTLSVEVWGAYL